MLLVRPAQLSFTGNHALQQCPSSPCFEDCRTFYKLGMSRCIFATHKGSARQKGRRPSEAVRSRGRQRSRLCRELYGRGLIGTLKASTWYQQLQERQTQGQGRQKRRPKAKNSVRMQVLEQLSPGHALAYQEHCCNSPMLLQPDMLASPLPAHSPAALGAFSAKTPSVQRSWALAANRSRALSIGAPLMSWAQPFMGIMESSCGGVMVLYVRDAVCVKSLAVLRPSQQPCG